MAADPYTTLGVKRDATAAQIKSAYLKLAKKHHPDLNPGDKKAEEKFKGISAAHDLLGDAEKRAKFDAGEIDATGRPRDRGPGLGGSPIAGLRTRRRVGAITPGREGLTGSRTCLPICLPRRGVAGVAR